MKSRVIHVLRQYSSFTDVRKPRHGINPCRLWNCPRRVAALEPCNTYDNVVVIVGAGTLGCDVLPCVALQLNAEERLYLKVIAWIGQAHSLSVDRR